MRAFFVDDRASDPAIGTNPHIWNALGGIARSVGRRLVKISPHDDRIGKPTVGTDH